LLLFQLGKFVSHSESEIYRLALYTFV